MKRRYEKEMVELKNIIPLKEESTEKEEIEIKSTEKPVFNLPTITLNVFCQLSGKKPDQIAGFRRYALNQKFQSLTVPQWREKLLEFENRPVQ